MAKQTLFLFALVLLVVLALKDVIWLPQLCVGRGVCDHDTGVLGVIANALEDIVAIP